MCPGGPMPPGRVPSILGRIHRAAFYRDRQSWDRCRPPPSLVLAQSSSAFSRLCSNEPMVVLNASDPFLHGIQKTFRKRKPCQLVFTHEYRRRSADDSANKLPEKLSIIFKIGTRLPGDSIDFGTCSLPSSRRRTKLPHGNLQRAFYLEHQFRTVGNQKFVCPDI